LGVRVGETVNDGTSEDGEFLLADGKGAVVLVEQAVSMKSIR
jgi:3-oxoacyl-[acyl-carrier-protein] synthase III